MNPHQFQAQQLPYPQHQYMVQQQQQPFIQQQFKVPLYYPNMQLPPYQQTGPPGWNQGPYGWMAQQYPFHQPPSILYTELPNYMDWYNNNNNISVSGKSTKLLNGASKFYVLGLCGRNIQDDVPDFFCIFDSNEDSATKFHTLDICLQTIQEMNTNVRYML